MFKPKDIIAILIIITWLVLKLKGINGIADGAFLLIIGYYFAKRRNGQDNGD